MIKLIKYGMVCYINNPTSRFIASIDLLCLLFECYIF